MKKFILFCFDDCYPAGGLGDMDSSYDTLKEAIEIAQTRHYDNREIVDRETWQIVWSAVDESYV